MTKSEIRNEIQQLIAKAGEVNPKEALAAQLKGHSKIVLYGAGNMGSTFNSYIKELRLNTEIYCFLDRNADEKPEYLGYPVYKPDDACLDSDFRKEVLVILTLLMSENAYDELVTQLRSMGYENFVNAYNLLGIGDSCLGDRGIFKKKEREILAAFDILSDDNSQKVFLSIFRAYIMLDYNLPVQNPDMTQYVNVNVPFRHKYHSFVDCGAFIGDTLEELVKSHKIEFYIGFEPDVQNYAKLSQKVNVLRDKMGQAVLLPLGVGDKNEFLHFSATAGGNSCISETGSVIVQTVCLDDVLKGYDRLMIKMDIEGAEVAALEGAKRIISETKPDLAICVYHKVSDLWRIPLMLKEWVPEYKFYIRNHFIGTYETVLYATLGEDE